MLKSECQKRKPFEETLPRKTEYVAQCQKIASENNTFMYAFLNTPLLVSVNCVGKLKNDKYFREENSQCISVSAIKTGRWTTSHCDFFAAWDFQTRGKSQYFLLR